MLRSSFFAQKHHIFCPCRAACFSPPLVVFAMMECDVVYCCPFRGLNGTIQIADTISDDLEELFCFYLVALEGTQIKEPIWFEHEEVELLTSPLVALEA